MIKIGVIGFGNMGEALTAGMIKNLDPFELLVCSRSKPSVQKASESYNAKIYSDPCDLVEASDFIILSIKPQDMIPMLEKISPYCDNKKGIISVAAGIKLSLLRDYIKEASLSRFMPNLAAKVGSSPVAVSFPDDTNQNFKDKALSFASAVGKAYEMKEELISAFIGISGSGIAYLFDVIHGLALGGTREGLAYSKSLEIVLDTMEGAAKVLKSNEENPAAMLSKVTSPAGTTIEGVKALAEGKLQDTLMEAVHRAATRSRELEG
ncbi:pyrroline-5-carboxylate reductase [Spirochaeta cellobiosiphila]|uniref:pyrroline-5-carboxylate reductase n=1 Tax=Spirochaeta cellobiosiphila TaxID=504483 RepID=UPI0004033662|nr:pyrroline-5-carboxylate reductase [Spirochaeta cellobiosiphila]